MLKKWMRRTMLVGSAAMAIVLGAASAAQADDTYCFLSDIDGHSLGYMVHLDPDPDTFKVCDTRADGHGVTGHLYRYDGYWNHVASGDDGGDAGCDYFGYPVVHGFAYMMKLCWNGSGDICHAVIFSE